MAISSDFFHKKLGYQESPYGHFPQGAWGVEGDRQQGGQAGGQAGGQDDHDGQDGQDVADIMANLSDEPPSDTAKLNEEKEELLRQLKELGVSLANLNSKWRPPCARLGSLAGITDDRVEP